MTRRLTRFQTGYRAAIFGANGAIGAALTTAIAQDDACGDVFALVRRPQETRQPKVRVLPFALEDETSIHSACTAIGETGPLDLVIVATGVLHSSAFKPEKSYRALHADAMAQVFFLNAIGPATIAKHALPLLARDRKAAFAALSAKVGSIADNQAGGWHSYRASKAALNMLVKNFAIELVRTHPLAVCLALHPGTVESRLSSPFRAGVRHTVFSPTQSASHLLRVIDAATPAQSGALLNWDGGVLAY